MVVPRQAGGEFDKALMTFGEDLELMPGTRFHYAKEFFQGL
jgi:hypothetical protein